MNLLLLNDFDKNYPISADTRRKKEHTMKMRFLNFWKKAFEEKWIVFLYWFFSTSNHVTTEEESDTSSLVVRVFASGLGDLGSITGRVIPKTLKMVLDTSLLNTQ